MSRSFKLIPEGETPAGDPLYSLWSTRADGFVLEDATRAELRAWAADAPEGADVPDVDELVAAVERRARRAGSHRYEDASEFLSGE
jgi:hypothetical protein